MKPDPRTIMPDDAAVARNAQAPGPPDVPQRREVASFGGVILGLAGLALRALLYLAAASLLAVVVVRVGADLLAGIDPFLSPDRRPRLPPRQLAMREIALDLLRQALLAALVVGAVWWRDRDGWRRTLALARAEEPGLRGEPDLPRATGLPASRLLVILLAWPVVHILWVTATAEMFSTSFGRHVSLAPGMPLVAAAAWLAYATLLAPLAEELLMRGEIFARARAFLGPAAAILATGLLFAVAHVSQVGWARPVSLLPLALMLGWLRWRTGRLWPCIALHAWSNLAVLVYVLWPSAT
ncbi:abortive infection protein [Methylobacterium sp. Leaf466]|nr:abortive infection protein [Methylobacterium sp. Leaf466]